MKKIFAFIVALGLCFGAVACNGGTSSAGTDSDTLSEEFVSNDSLVESESVASSEEYSDSDTVFDSSSDENSSSEEESNSDSIEDDSSEESIQQVKVTFKQDGQMDIVKTLKQGETLTDIPMPISKMGYMVEWNTVDFINITEDMTVYAVETAKTYTVVLNVNGGSVMQTTITVTYGQAYKLMIPTKENKVFDGWFYNGIHISLSGIWEIDTEEAEVTLIAEWSNGGWTGNY